MLHSNNNCKFWTKKWIKKKMNFILGKKIRDNKVICNSNWYTIKYSVPGCVWWLNGYWLWRVFFGYRSYWDCCWPFWESSILSKFLPRSWISHEYKTMTTIHGILPVLLQLLEGLSMPINKRIKYQFQGLLMRHFFLFYIQLLVKENIVAYSSRSTGFFFSPNIV